MANYGKKNKVKDGLENYSVALFGESGIGKTTLMYEVCEKLFGSDGYMIFNAGKEQGIDCLEDASYEDIENFKKFDAVVSDIIKNKKSDYPDLKVVVLDTLDQIIEIVEPEIVRRYNSENLGVKDFKPAKTINGAYGGFQNGQDECIKLILNKIWDLQSVGVRVWYTGHVKTKESIDPYTNMSFTSLSTNISNKYLNGFKTKIHALGIACIDRTIETEDTGRENIVTHKKITVNKVKAEKRKIVFRDDNYSVDSKSRLADIVDEISMDSDAFIKAIENAIESAKNKKVVSKSNTSKKKSNKTYDEELSDDKENLDDIENTNDIDDVLLDSENSNYPEDLVEETRALFQKCKDNVLKTEVRETVKSFGKFTDVPENELKSLYDKLSK
jgi:GTPase SAR1 family protein